MAMELYLQYPRCLVKSNPSDMTRKYIHPRTLHCGIFCSDKMPAKNDV